MGSQTKSCAAFAQVVIVAGLGGWAAPSVQAQGVPILDPAQAVEHARQLAERLQDQAVQISKGRRAWAASKTSSANSWTCLTRLLKAARSRPKTWGPTIQSP